jgi:TrfA protein
MKEEPVAVVQRLIKTIETKRKKQSEQKAETLPALAKVIQLPAWGVGSRGAPNEILRSALFNARNKKRQREYLEKATIAVIGEGEITYTGRELRQDDETVWLQLIHLARELPLGELVEFTAYSFIKSLGWNNSAKSYKRLRDSLERMQATALTVYSKRIGEGVSLSMIPFFAWRQGRNGPPLPMYQVRIAPELIELFSGVRYTLVEWQQRLALPDGLATWLHGYYASHKEPYPIKRETIREGAGLTIKRKDHLKEQTEIALEALKRVGFLKSWKIKDDLVYVERAR